MAASSNDPLAIWRDMVTSLESNFNSASNKLMESQEFSRTMNQFTSVATGAQQSFNTLMERYLATLNLPTASQIKDLSERLTAIEGQLSDLTSLLQNTAHAPERATGTPTARPTRTRRPDPEGGS